jgi:hypothetical protein
MEQRIGIEQNRKHVLTNTYLTIELTLKTCFDITIAFIGYVEREEERICK